MQLRLPLQSRPAPRPEPGNVVPATEQVGQGAGAPYAHDEPSASGPKQLVLGALLGALMLGGMALLILGRGSKVAVGLPPAPVPAVVAAPPPPPEPAPSEPPAAESFERTVSRALEIETVELEQVRRFLGARRPEEYAPLVRNPDVALPRIREFLPNNPPPMLGVRSMKVTLAPDGSYSASLNMEDFSIRRMILHDATDGLRVDWEAWVGWSSMPWDQFKASKPSEPQLFRVTVAPVDYFNYEFKDETRWSAWMLSSRQNKEFVYGYLARNSVTETKFLSMVKNSAGEMILMLAFPPNASANNLCEITDVIAAGWAEPPTAGKPAPRKP